jgi:hypothetical protein
MVSRALYEQVCGRATRPICADQLNELESAEPIERRLAIATSKKPDCVMIDFMGNGNRLSLVRGSWAIDCGLDDEAALKVERLARMQQTDLASAANQVELEELLGDRPDLLLEVVKANDRPIAYTVDNRNPFAGTPSSLAIEYLGVRTPSIISIHRETALALPEQVRILQSCGITDAELLTAERAAALISEIMIRRRHGLADPRQIDLLVTVGDFPAEKVRKLTHDRAGRGIGQLKDNNWVRPAAWDKPRPTAGSVVEAECSTVGG